MRKPVEPPAGTLALAVALGLMTTALLTGCMGTSTTTSAQQASASPQVSSAASSPSTTIESSSSSTLGDVVLQGDSGQKLTSGGSVRAFMLHVPPSYDESKSVPLVLAYRGHGGTGSSQAQLTHMSDVADANGFIVVYPDGANHAWNDGREGINGADQSIDDVGFTRDLIEHLEAEYMIDTSRIYATGFSNGGFMCYRLARDLPELVAAIAPVAGLLSQALADDFTSSTPISTLIIQGTADPLIPYEGGEVAAMLSQSRGLVLSALETASFFVELDGCSGPAISLPIPNAALLDGARAERTIWDGGRRDTKVELYTIFGGGHTWPAGLQYSPVRITGPTCRDFDASEVIWEFFAQHPRRD